MDDKTLSALHVHTNVEGIATENQVFCPWKYIEHYSSRALAYSEQYGLLYVMMESARPPILLGIHAIFCRALSTVATAPF